VDCFLGESVDFWAEVKKDLHKKGKMELTREIVELRSKVSFYESRIKQLSDFMKINVEVRYDEKG